MTHVQLGDVARIHSKTLNPAKQTETVFEVFSIPAFDDGQSPEVLTGAEIRSSKTALPEIGVLFSKLNPRINRVWLLPESNNRTRISSTEFVCLVPDEAKLLPEYLAWRLKTPGIEKELPLGTAAATKSRERIRPTDLLSIPIFLPPIEEQRRIVDILNRAASIERLKARASAHLCDFIPALFLKMFGDPIENPMGWPVVEFGSLVQGFQGGKNVQAGSGTSPYRILKVSAVTSGEFKADESKPAPDDHEPPAIHFVRDGDILFSRANTADLVGATALVYKAPRGTLLPDKLWRVVLKEGGAVDPMFLLSLLKDKSVRAAMSNLATGTSSSMQNISQGKLKTLPVITPPPDLQRKFAKLVEAAQARARLAEKADGLAADLSQSLLDRLLRGDSDADQAIPLEQSA